jgi:hypothetical protein
VETDEAIVMSFYKNEYPAGSLRINLKWKDKHEITDFKLDQFGEYLSCDNESENTGWVIVKPRGNVSPGDTIPLL